MSNSANYVIVTAAHNEEEYLEKTIHSVLAQGHKPVRWVIVDDGSVDQTKSIAEQAATQASFIRVVSIVRDGTRSFNNKARAFERGREALKDTPYDFLGNLDADISFGPDYFSNLLREFSRDPHLGITGGSVYTRIDDRYVSYDQTIDSVGGAVQLFRRACFEDIGGYPLLPYGGIDAAAEIMAKAAGWRVKKSLTDKVLEHRRTGSATAAPLAACFHLGRRFHSLGYGKMFYLFRCLYRLREKPVIIGSFASALGFLESMVKRRQIALPKAVVDHLRAEQKSKLWHSVNLSRPWQRGTRRLLVKGWADTSS